jgi:hypothetical protein
LLRPGLSLTVLPGFFDKIKSLKMTTKEKSDKIKSIVLEMLNESHEAMVKKIDKALTCGAIDVESWSESNAPMILPKCIVIAILQNEATQYDGKGTSFEKQIKKEVSSLRCFL